MPNMASNSKSKKWLNQSGKTITWKDLLECHKVWCIDSLRDCKHINQHKAERIYRWIFEGNKKPPFTFPNESDHNCKDAYKEVWEKHVIFELQKLHGIGPGKSPCLLKEIEDYKVYASNRSLSSMLEHYTHGKLTFRCLALTSTVKRIQADEEQKYIIRLYVNDNATGEEQETHAEYDIEVKDNFLAHIRAICGEDCVKEPKMDIHVSREVFRDDIRIYQGIQSLKQEDFIEANNNKHVKMVNIGLGIQMTDEQSVAVQSFLANRLVCISGKAGTGKSRICIPAIVMIAIECGYRPVCLGPTAETTNNFEKRIQFLRNMWTKDTTRNRDECAMGVSTLSAFFSSGSSCDISNRKTLLVVDDASLISSSMMADLIELVYESEETHLVLCGDPSWALHMKERSAFTDMVASDMVRTISLTTQKRCDLHDVAKIVKLYEHDNYDRYWSWLNTPKSLLRQLECGQANVTTKFSTSNLKETEGLLYAGTEFKKILRTLMQDGVDVSHNDCLRTLCTTDEQCRFFAQHFREVAFGHEGTDVVNGEYCRFTTTTQFYNAGDVARVMYNAPDSQFITIQYEACDKKIKELMRHMTEMGSAAENTTTELYSHVVKLESNVVTLKLADKSHLLPDSVVKIDKVIGLESDICICLFPSLETCHNPGFIYAAASRARKRLILIGDTVCFNGYPARPYKNPRQLTMLSILLQTNFPSPM